MSSSSTFAGSGRSTSGRVSTINLAAADLLRQHADVLFRSDASGRLVAVNEPDGEAPPRLFLARGRATPMVRFRVDVPQPTANACRQLAALLGPWDGLPSDPESFEPLRLVLLDGAAVTLEDRGPAFHFQEPALHLDEHATPQLDTEAILVDERSAYLLERHYPYTRANLESRSPVVGVVADGAVVAACYSARRTASACEAGVHTQEAYRGRGYAPRVVSMWRDAVERTGAQPLYSTTWDNTGSLAVARKLGLLAYAETLSIA